MMSRLLKPLGQLLTTLPVGAEYPGGSAGPNFEFYRTSYLLPHRHAAWVLMNERLLELADYCARLGTRPSAPPELTTIRRNTGCSPGRWINTSAENAREPKGGPEHNSLSTYFGE